MPADTSNEDVLRSRADGRGDQTDTAPSSTAEQAKRNLDVSNRNPSAQPDAGGPPTDSATIAANDSPATIGDVASEAALATGAEPMSADDLSWATPRPRASRRLLGLVGLLAALLVGLGGFAYGTKVGRDRAASSGAAGRSFPGFGRNGLPGAFGGGAAGGGAGGAAVLGADTATTTADTTPADPLGGLLAGAPPAADAAAAGTGATTGAALTGTIERVDGDTLVITTASGPVTVRLTPNTAVRRQDAATTSDLVAGAQISITVATTPTDPTATTVAPGAATELAPADAESITIEAAAAIPEAPVTDQPGPSTTEALPAVPSTSTATTSP